MKVVMPRFVLNLSDEFRYHGYFQFFLIPSLTTKLRGRVWIAYYKWKVSREEAGGVLGVE